MAETISAKNDASKKTLTVFQSAAIINGCGIGAGILAIPFFASKVGIYLAIILVLVAYIGIYVIHLMIAELALRNKRGSQIVDIIKESKLFGKNTKVFSVVVFVLMTVILSCDLSSYVVAAADILHENVVSVPVWAWKIIFYIFAAIIALFGLKVLGITEKYATIVIFVTVLALIIGSMFHLDNKVAEAPQSVKDVFGYTSTCMFAFNAFFSVPQVVDGLNADKKKVRKSIALGMLFNLLTILTIMIFCLLSADEITNPCIIGWSKSIGSWATIVGLIFTLLALFSSYWAISFSLRDIIHNQFHLDIKLCWLLSTLPSLFVSLLISLVDNKNGFSLFISISSIVEALLVSSFILPTFHRARKESKKDSTIFAKFGNIGIEIIGILTIAIFCVGGIINIINEFII